MAPHKSCGITVIDYRHKTGQEGKRFGNSISLFKILRSSKLPSQKLGTWLFIDDGVEMEELLYKSMQHLSEKHVKNKEKLVCSCESQKEAPIIWQMIFEYPRRPWTQWIHALLGKKANKKPPHLNPNCCKWYQRSHNKKTCNRLISEEFLETLQKQPYD